MSTTVPSAGGALLPYQKQEFKTDVKIDGNLVVVGTVTSSGSTGPTLTDPTIADGLTASGSTTNDFSGSTGAFKTSTGANTLSGAVSIADAATPSLTTATGKTNTGFVTVLGKTSGGLKVTTADATAQTVTITAAAQTSGASTLTIPDQAGASSAFVFTTLAQTLTNKTLTAPTITAPVITNSVDYKVLAANATYSATTTPTALTGFSWTVVAGTYVFDLNLPATMTTNGGLTVSFVLTTAVLTSIQYQSYAATASDNTTAVSTNGTTTTSTTKVFDSKTDAYTHVNIKGSMVVGTGGTFAWFATQNTSAGAGDATVVAIGSMAQMTRVA